METAVEQIIGCKAETATLLKSQKRPFTAQLKQTEKRVINAPFLD
jgi:hypothetical protein